MILTMKGADNQVEIRTDAFSVICRNFLEILVHRLAAVPLPPVRPAANKDSTWCCPYLDTHGCDVIASLPSLQLQRFVRLRDNRVGDEAIRRQSAVRRQHIKVTLPTAGLGGRA